MGDLEAIHAREPDVKEDRLGAKVASYLDGRWTVVGDAYVMSPGSE